MLALNNEPSPWDGKRTKKYPGSEARQPGWLFSWFDKLTMNDSEILVFRDLQGQE